MLSTGANKILDGRRLPEEVNARCACETREVPDWVRVGVFHSHATEAMAVVQARYCRRWFMHLQSKRVVWRSEMRRMLVALSLGPGERGELPQRRGQWTSTRYR